MYLMILILRNVEIFVQDIAADVEFLLWLTIGDDNDALTSELWFQKRRLIYDETINIVDGDE